MHASTMELAAIVDSLCSLAGKEHVMPAAMDTPQKFAPNEYEEIRRKNLEDNKAVLSRLMSDLHGKGPLKPPPPKEKRKHGSYPQDNGPTRRNPTRHARYHPSRFDLPRTRSRSGSVSSSVSSSSSCSPSSTPEKLVVRFGFFRKSGPADVELDVISDEESLDLPAPSRQPRISHEIRSAEDISDDDLKLVALAVSDKSYDSISGTTCHQCRQKTDDLKTMCRSSKCFGVRGQFCGPCLRNRYGEDARVALKDPNWTCPPCREICNCSFCRKRNGKSCTGILIHMAREKGFDDVHSFLKGLNK